MMFFGSGVIGLIAWLSAGALIIAGIVALSLKPHKRKRGEHWFFGCAHVQFLLFMLTYPIAQASAAYLTLSPIPDVYAGDMVEAIIGVLIELLICLSLSIAVAMRHSGKPKFSWFAMIAVVAILCDMMCIWSFKMVLATMR
mgnify:FL=1